MQASNSTRNGEDSDEDTQCALSENWTFEKKTRRWSRIVDVTQGNLERLQTLAGQNLPSEEESMEERMEAEEAEDSMYGLRFAGQTDSKSGGDEVIKIFLYILKIKIFATKLKN